MRIGSSVTRYQRFLIYAVIVILLNIAGITLFYRIDLTQNNIYSLSEASKKAVSSLSEPLTIKVFFNKNLPAPYNTVERYLHDLLEEYAMISGRYFNYQFYNVSSEGDERSRYNQELAESYGIYPVQVQSIEHDEVSFKKAYMGMVFIQGDMVETIPTITTTEGLEYKITTTIQKMNNKISALLRLKDKIKVKLFLSSSLGAVGPYMNITGLPDLPSKIEDIVKELNTKNYGKLKFIYIDPSTDETGGKEAEKYNILRLNWDTFRDHRGKLIKAGHGYAGIVVEHGDRYRNIELIRIFRLPLFGTQYQLARLDEIKEAIDDTIDRVIDINQQIGYLADHGTVTLTIPPQFFGLAEEGGASNFNKLLSEAYSVKHINLKNGIPEGLPFLIIAGPTEKFTDYELFQIDQYLMKGNNLAIFLDSYKEEKPEGGGFARFRGAYYSKLDTGLEKLLEHYGLNIRKSIVLDENCFKKRVPRAFGGGERSIYYAPIIKNENINKDVKFLRNIKGLVMLKASPVDVDEEKISKNNLKAIRLFTSSERSWEKEDLVNFNPVFMTPPSDEDEFKSIPLAYIVEGQFTSYFADRPIPPKEEDKGKDKDKMKEKKKEDISSIKPAEVVIKKGKPAKIFLIGTSAILKDNVIDEEGRTPNAQFVMNVIDYLNNREDIAIMRSKTQKFNPIRDVSPAIRTSVKTANIAGLPILVIISGMIVWGRRKSRKRLIQRLYSK